MRIRPCKGRSVVNERAPHLLIAEAGENVDDTHYYRRRIARGDAELIPDPKPEKAPKAVN
jgi:hypothetical protein